MNIKEGVNLQKKPELIFFNYHLWLTTIN